MRNRIWTTQIRRSVGRGVHEPPWIKMVGRQRGKTSYLRLIRTVTQRQPPDNRALNNRRSVTARQAPRSVYVDLLREGDVLFFDEATSHCFFNHQTHTSLLYGGEV